ncbi:PadR family transcriptional regulator [Nonomuraea candida]|uniref:PadR family transcriptional regulator n=1 Tax=Nonomuraea candida TaxID=359159 RepID=UPI0005B80CD3|nr:PadR family transcriptional regulator [Nonomuraea candida]
MSPVFGHGRLRLYLLKLLEESPRHGYEVIRLLQDRFLGVYSPSPGTIYPRLARLEEEGLVTHEVIDGKKVFSITDKGREELNARLDELDDLEQEISASVRDIAREVKEDVRDTVKSLREELTRIAKDVRTGAADDSRRLRDQQKEEFRRLRDQQRHQWTQHAHHWQDEGERISREWRGIWSEVWATLGGDPSGPANRAELDAELGELLADFVAEAREEASKARLTPEKLAELRTTLHDASRAIHDILDR